MDQPLDVQSLINANFNESLDVTLNGLILAPSKSRQYELLDITLNGQILARSKSRQCKLIDITLNGPILARSKSRQCELRQISWHHFEWTNVSTFKVSSIQTSANLLASL
uniref:Uncharacterized protein n=1 Tax=viral metagenome TaxID=1070528 RepID=A0A6C0C9Z5_9ZZZZ